MEVWDVATKRQYFADIFNHNSSKISTSSTKANDKEEPKECAVCGKMVYSVEKMQLERKVYHRSCFKCCKCQKSLNVQNYTTSEGELYCKLHIMEKFNPDIALSHELKDDSTNVDDMEPDEDEDYAVVTRPKALDPNIVRSGIKSTEDLENIPNLSDKKKEWTEQASGVGKIEKRTEIDSDIFQHGKVKARMSKFADGENNIMEAEDGEVDGEDEETKDPNVVRESKKREEIKVEVGAKTMRSKWESAAAENASGDNEDRRHELSELKRNISIKERFKERTSSTENGAGDRRKSALDDLPDLNTSSIQAAKERFLKGEAFHENSPERQISKEDIKFSELSSFKERFERPSTEETRSEYSPTSARCSELSDIKASFEQGGKKKYSEEELESRKKDNLEREFKRIQKEKRILKEKERREAEEAAKYLVKVVPYENPDDVRQCAELGSIKQRFEEGTVYKAETAPRRLFDEDLEIKVASKARQKFMQIDQEGPGTAAIQVAGSNATKDGSKWAKDHGPKPEPINRRVLTDDPNDNNEDFEVKNLLNKFKNIEQGGAQNGEHKAPKPVRQITPPPPDYKSELVSEGKERDPNVVSSENRDENAAVVVKVEAKSIKAKFENAAEINAENGTSEQKRKNLAEEFEKIKELKESQKQTETDAEEPKDSEPSAQPSDDKPDLAIAAEHTQKMRAKWDKIQKKEAKKAQKSSSMRKSAQAASRYRANHDSETCSVCDRKVYLAERIGSDNHFYHKTCFKCKTCNTPLRLENCAPGDDGFLYCQVHYKCLFNDMSHPLYHGSPGRETTPPVVVTNGFHHD